MQLDQVQALHNVLAPAVEPDVADRRREWILPL
jgi:hypothetical protein